MEWYEKIVRDQRIKKAEITQDNLKKIHKIYESSINEIAKDIEVNGSNSIWLNANHKALKEHEEKLRKELNSTISEGISKGADVGINANSVINSEILKTSGLNVDETFNSMFAKVHQNVVDNIVTGALYKDNKTLSDRIWNYTNANKKDIQDVITEGITLKKSARELANDLKEFVKPPQNRDPNFARDYPDKAAKQIDYQAMRLARTAINHSYQTATIQSSMNNPFVEGIEWHSSLDHRACEVCVSRHGQIYPKDDVPLDHPNGVCTMIPYIPKSFDDIGSDIADWINGEENEGIDNWVMGI